MIASTYVFRPLILKISTGAFYYPEHTVFLEVDVQSLTGSICFGTFFCFCKYSVTVAVKGSCIHKER